jgi:hypothetical protein
VATKVPALALVLAVVGCGELTGPGDDLDNEDLAFLALEADALTGQLVDDMGFGLFAGSDLLVGSADPRDTSGSFTRTHECPAGGTLTVTGTLDRSRNDAGVVEWDVSGSGEWADCARRRREITRTIDGQFEFESHRSRQNGEPVGLQTSHKSGSFTWTRSDGQSGTCEFDITSTRDPVAGTRTVTGTICGREIERTVEWRKRG